MRPRGEASGRFIKCRICRLQVSSRHLPLVSPGGTRRTPPMYERYQVTSTRLHVVELERSRVLDEDVAWHVILAGATGTGLMALSLEQAAAFAESLRDAERLIEEDTVSPRDLVVFRSGFFVVRAVPWI